MKLAVARLREVFDFTDGLSPAVNAERDLQKLP
jgi:hypothetical protein